MTLITTSELHSILGEDCCLNPLIGRVEFDGFGALNETGRSGYVTFCSAHGQKAIEDVNRSAAAIVFWHKSAVLSMTECIPHKLVVGVENPRLSFIEMYTHFVDARRPRMDARHLAYLSNESYVDDDASIGPGVIIGPKCRISAGCVIEAGAVIKSHTQLGRGCWIESGAVIGNEGFGYERKAQGQLCKFPQIGSVVIGKDVAIGANVTIDRGALSDTCIGDGSKIDDGVYIAHNVQVGRNCIIMARVTLCGSCELADQVEISPGAIVRERISIGERARIGLGAVVVKDVNRDILVAGVPARPFSNK